MPVADALTSRLNSARWSRGDLVAHYATRDLRPVEATLLLRYREALSGRVLELGCGAGRVTGYLVELSDAVHGIDVAAPMVEHCRRTYPQATFSALDLRELRSLGAGAFDVVAGFYNVLGVLDEADRRTVLADIHAVLAPGGALLLSTHNRAHARGLRPPTHVLARDPRRMAENVARLPVRMRNHRRLRAMEREAPGWALRNDEAHDYSLLHYYAEPDAVSAQLAELGYAVEACLDGEGRAIAPGERAPESNTIHHWARRT